MITLEQQTWLNHLSETSTIKIIPYNPKNREVFKLIKKDLFGLLGKTRISLRGSTALKISGQGENDLYIPVDSKNFNIYLEKLIKYLGEPGSLYPLKRVRFIKYIDDIKTEIFLINKNDTGWKTSVKFEKYLKRHPEAVVEYEQLKKSSDGASVKEYYTKKTIFINKIIKLAE